MDVWDSLPSFFFDLTKNSLGLPPVYSPLRLTCRKLKGFIKQWKLKDIVKNQDKTRWEEDYTLLENEGLFDEYLEMGQYPHTMFNEYLEMGQYPHTMFTEYLEMGQYPPQCSMSI